MIKYAFFDGSTWTTEIVDGQTAGPYCSLALDSVGRPRIAYRYYEGHSIRYAVRGDGGTWTFYDFETDNDEESYISMALDTMDRPHVSYYDGYILSQPHDLKYAYFNGSSWNAVVVDASGQVGRGSSLALDSRNLPHISYYDETNVSAQVRALRRDELDREYPGRRGSAALFETVPFDHSGTSPLGATDCSTM